MFVTFPLAQHASPGVVCLQFRTQQYLHGARARLSSAPRIKAPLGPAPPQLICMCMAQRTIAPLRACQLQRSAQSVHCLGCRCLRSHAAPSAAPCRWGSARAGPGGGCQWASSAGGGGRAGSDWFGPAVEVPSIIWCPASCCRDYCLLAGTW